MKKQKVNIRKGQAFAILIFILAIFLLGFTYSILMKPVGVLYNRVYNNSELQDDEYQTFFVRTRTIWFWILPIVIIPLIIWAINEGNRRGQQYG